MTRVGAQYYRPPNPPRTDWGRDLHRMREHGFNTVKFWCCWSWMNPSPGRYDFDDLDELMDLAAEAGLGVVLNTILENAPYWLEPAHPAARYVDSDDRCVQLTGAMNTPGGGWPGLCFDNTPVWEEAKTFLGILVSRYRGHEALDLWDVWNEPHLEPASYFPERWYCYCRASVSRFRSWLLGRYGDIETLNSAWSRRYGSWQEVCPPRVFESVPDLMDWREFWFQNLRQWLEARVGHTRSCDPDHMVMTHVALSGYSGQLATHTIDEHLLGDVADVFGTSSFPGWLMGNDPVEHLFNLEAARAAAAGRPYWQAELQGGKGRRLGARSTPHPAPEDIALWMWDAVASGASGLMFWQWRPELLGPESPGYGLCTPAGEVTDRLLAAARVARVLASDDLRNLALDRAEVAVLVSRATALHSFATDRGVGLYLKAVMGAFRMLADSDQHVTFAHETTLAQAQDEAWPSVLYWPMPALCTNALAGALMAFVQRGGVLIAEASPGEYDDLGRHRTLWPSGPLSDLFGARVIDNDVAPRTVVEVAGGRLTGAWQVDQLEVGLAEVIGRLPDGRPGATLKAHGKGKAVLLATYPSLFYEAHRDDANRQAILRLCSPHGDGRPSGASWLRPQPGLFSRAGAVGTSGKVVVFLNWTAEAQHVDCTTAYSVMGTGHGRLGHVWSPPGRVLVPRRSSLALLLDPNMTSQEPQLKEPS